MSTGSVWTASIMSVWLAAVWGCGGGESTPVEPAGDVTEIASLDIAPENDPREIEGDIVVPREVTPQVDGIGRVDVLPDFGALDATDLDVSDTTDMDVLDLVNEVCTPDCDGKDCGDDGCGGVCGVCGLGKECVPSGLCVPIPPVVGLWEFDDPYDLTHATTGNDLELVGQHSPVLGPEEGDGAAQIGEGSFYRCYHDIAPNGTGGADPQWVNRFTIVMDFQAPVIGEWYSFYQTNDSNSNDGDAFINPSGHIGVMDTGYSNYQVSSGEWYRLVISADLGVHYDYYLDGQLLHHGGAQDFDGRFSLYPAGDANQVLFFADDNGEDSAILVARVALFDTDLNAEEVAALGGFGHDVPSPEAAEMKPYLQSPTPTSIYVSWHSSLSEQSIVEYGPTEALGQQQVGDAHVFNSQTIWHTVQLTGLAPDAEYFYRCVTGTAQTAIHRFRTQPPDDTANGHVRFVVYGDTRTDYWMHAAVVDAMKAKLIDLYGAEYHNEVNAVINVGDIVTTGQALSQYIGEHFGPTAPVTSNLPYMISIGNHEAEADHYYEYMKYEDFGGPEGEKYYSFRMGRVLFISLNSNVQGDTQLEWLDDELAFAEGDDGIQMVFAFLHHPGRSEIWPDGNTGWVQDEVIPLLAQYDKVEQLAYGHSHNYERGATGDGNLRLLLSGGGGSALDRWGMYANQTDYPEIHRAMDHYCYTIVDVDVADNSYTAETYSLGHGDLSLDNVLIDGYSRARNAPAPSTPLPISPAGAVSSPVTLIASGFSAPAAMMSSQFQVTEDGGTWQNPLFSSLLDHENVYGDTGAPDYEPVDLNKGVDLTVRMIPPGLMQTNQTYKWRARYRDQNLNWSGWSEEAEFVYD